MIAAVRVSMLLRSEVVRAWKGTKHAFSCCYPPLRLALGLATSNASRSPFGRYQPPMSHSPSTYQTISRGAGSVAVCAHPCQPTPLTVRRLPFHLHFGTAMLAQSVASKALAKRLLTRCTQPRSRSLLPSHTSAAHRCSPLCHHAQHAAAFSSASSSHSSFDVSSSSPASSSASSSSSFFSASFAGISALVVATGAAIVAITTTTEAVEAEAATAFDTTTSTTTATPSSASLPLILPTITPTSPTPYSSRPAAASGSPQSILATIAPPRPSLPNPGKFDHTHREASNLTNSQAFGGGRIQLGLPLFAPDAITGLEPDKQVVLIPVVQAGEGGGHGMLNVRTSLGHRHAMEGMIDTQWNIVGEYKYIHAPWVIKPSFRSITQQGDDVSLEVDYRGREFVAQAHAGLQRAGVRAVVPAAPCTATCQLGVQLHAHAGPGGLPQLHRALQQPPGRPAVPLPQESDATCCRTTAPCWTSPPPPPQPAQQRRVSPPSCACTRQSQAERVGGGLQYARPLFKYALCVVSDWRVGVMLEQNVGGERCR